MQIYFIKAENVIPTEYKFTSSRKRDANSSIIHGYLFLRATPRVAVSYLPPDRRTSSSMLSLHISHFIPEESK